MSDMDTKEFYDRWSQWCLSIKPDLDFMTEILAQSLPDDPEQLIISLESAEAWNGRAGFILAEANTWLDKAKWLYLPSREDHTELSRKSKQGYLVANFMNVRDKAEALLQAIKQRLILGESILAYSRQFKDPVIKHDERKLSDVLKESRP